ncbi:MAG: hypothetical protein KF683_07800 [Rubrivivax sp.]|nr:hypothetical protein [Rubrivivax sp.]
MSHEAPGAAACPEQVYLIDRDAGLLCRILGLYAARALDVLQVDYANAAQDLMRLRVTIGRGDADTGEGDECVRVLVEKASTLVGVIAAAERPGDAALGADCLEA